MNKQILSAISILAVLCASHSVSAEAPAKAAICKACHGEAGAKPLMDAYPKLAGQNAAYLESALKSYRSGERKGGMSAVMAGQAKALSDEDIKALAAYYSAQ